MGGFFVAGLGTGFSQILIFDGGLSVSFLTGINSL